MFKHWAVRTRLRFAFGSIILVFLACTAAAGKLLQTQIAATEAFETHRLPAVLAVDDMALAVSEVQQFLTDVSATHERDAFEEASASANRFRKHLAAFRSQAESGRDAAALAELAALSTAFETFQQTGERMANVYMAQGLEAGNALMKGDGNEPGFDKRSEDLLKTLDAFREPRVAAALASASQLRASSVRVQWILWIGALGAAILAIGVSHAVTNHIHRVLGGDPSEAAELARRVGAGDLSTPAATAGSQVEGVLAQLRSMQTGLAELVRGVMNGSSGVALASAQIAAGNADLSTRTASQISALQQASATMDELRENVARNASDAKEVCRLVDESCEIAVRSGQEVAQVIGTMEGIEQASGKMSDIISVIDGIAFQTNILALNAAVEAARAGDQGRGFAVVASEVRGLAGRSAAAARDIRELIQTNVQRVVEGVHQVRGAGQSVDGLVEHMKEAATFASRIQEASAAQSEEVESAAQSVSGMNELTVQNTALVLETAEAAARLEAQAQSLLASVRIFRLEAAG